MKRRDLLKTIPLLASGGVRLPGIGAAQVSDTLEEPHGFMELSEIARNVFFAKGKISYFENGDLQQAQCNNGFVIFDRFVLIIDSNFPVNARILLSEIRKITDKPIKLVFNTHHHGDHLYGNHYWMQQGVLPIAYVGLVYELKKYETGFYGNAPGRWEMVQSNRSDLEDAIFCPPDLLFDSHMLLEDKSMRVELMHLGKGHTLGDAIAWLPKERILFGGDSCLTGPYNLLVDAHIASWINTLHKMTNLRPDVVVPGHGMVGNTSAPESQRSYLEYLFNWVTTEKRNKTDWIGIESRLPVLRDYIKNHETARQYLISEPSVASGFSLQAHVKRIFDELS